MDRDGDGSVGCAYPFVFGRCWRPISLLWFITPPPCTVLMCSLSFCRFRIKLNAMPDDNIIYNYYPLHTGRFYAHPHLCSLLDTIPFFIRNLSSLVNYIPSIRWPCSYSAFLSLLSYSYSPCKLSSRLPGGL